MFFYGFSLVFNRFFYDVPTKGPRQNEIAFVAKTLEVVLIEVLSWEAPWMVGDFRDGLLGLIGVQQCHKPPIWEWFIPPIYGEIGGWCTLYKCFFMCFQFGSLNRNLATRRDHAQTKIGLELFSKNPECTYVLWTIHPRS